MTGLLIYLFSLFSAFSLASECQNLFLNQPNTLQIDYLGQGGQAIVYRVYNPITRQYTIEKVLRSDGGLSILNEGINSMLSTAQHELVTLNFLSNLFKKIRIPLSVSSPKTVLNSNRYGIKTNAWHVVHDVEIAEVGTIAPTLVLKDEIGKTVDQIMEDTSIPLAKKLIFAKKFSDLAVLISKQIAKKVYPNLIKQNEIHIEDYNLLLPNGEIHQIRRKIAVVELGPIEGSKRFDKTISFSTFWNNLLIREDGKIVLIDSD